MIKTMQRWLQGKGRGVSILVPFQCREHAVQRAENWMWLKKYWQAHFPWAQIVIGEDRVSNRNLDLPFSKSAAVNDAVKKATGDIFVIVDADGFLAAKSVEHCVEKIREDRDKGFKLWFIPYRQFYRLTPVASKELIESDPECPYEIPTPPPPIDIQNVSGSGHGHWWGAGIQIMPREAFEEVGGWDERFRGWGGEDHAAMRAMDTLYWPHKTLPGQFLHIWHPMFSPTATSDWVDWKERVWANQTIPGTNEKLTGRYYGARGDRKRMRKLLDEGKDARFTE